MNRGDGRAHLGAIECLLSVPLCRNGLQHTVVRQVRHCGLHGQQQSAGPRPIGLQPPEAESFRVSDGLSTTSPLDVDDLVTRSLAGDDQALGELLLAVRHKLEKVAYSRLPQNAARCPAERQDFVQSCLVHAVSVLKMAASGAASFRGRRISEFVAWLRTIAERKAIDQARHLRASQRAGIRVTSGLAVESVAEDPGTEPQSSAQRCEAQKLVQDALGGLPLADRKLVEFRVYHGLSFREIAARTGQRVEELYWHWHRLKGRLREHAAIRRARSALPEGD